MRSENIKLSKRLQLIANKVPDKTRVVDVGTDHAYIPIYLIQNNISLNVIASDIRKGPIKIAKRNIKKYKLSDRIETRISNGLENIKKNEVDTVIIAGMGGILINQILSSAKDLLNEIGTIILQPMIAQEEVRLWLNKNNYRIIDEELTKERNIYNVIVATKGFEQIKNEIHYYIGKKLIEKNDPLLDQLLINKINKTIKIINELQNSKSKNQTRLINKYKTILDEYQKLLMKIKLNKK